MRDIYPKEEKGCVYEYSVGQGAGVCESMDTCEVAGVCGHTTEAERRQDRQGMWGQILIQVNSY